MDLNLIAAYLCFLSTGWLAGRASQDEGAAARIGWFFAATTLSFAVLNVVAFAAFPRSTG